MARPGDQGLPLRVAVIGSGPAGFFVVEHLLKKKNLDVAVDIYERLPAPFGLVRYGVAPDHQKIKSVIKKFERLADDPRCRYFGNVEYGRQLTLEDLRRHYHQVCFATGAQTDRSLGVPGEELGGSHAATEFVAWYNGHPDYRELEFDLTAESVAVVGVGNVAVDVARILCRTTEELERTDIADYALEALRTSRVREVHMLGRRGPAQAKFTNPELKELGELAGADTLVLKDELELDPVSQAALERQPDRETTRRLEMLRKLAEREPAGKPRRLALRFLVSPVEILGRDDRVSGLKLVRNVLEEPEQGWIRAVPTDHVERLEVGLVFRSVGYRGVALAELPFDERGGTVPHRAGRVVDGEGRPLTGLYAAGWIKRGPSGVIGTNKPDAGESVESMLADAAAGRTLRPTEPGVEAAESRLLARHPEAVSYEDWKRLDAEELAAGRAAGRPRVKLTSVGQMLAALDRA